MLKNLGADSLMVCETNLDGVITHANKDFALACELEPELIIGFKPNVFRSPDMPKWAYKKLWENLANDKKWVGVLKNKTFNGSSYYWRKFDIRPMFDCDGVKIGYRGENRQATKAEVEHAMELYGIELD